MKLTDTTRRFVLHWGEMGTRWGINRSVAQIHALLFVSPAPLPADEIAETLDIARSNVSGSLRELQGWGLVRVAHQLGDRRDHFETTKDVWTMVRIVAEGRKRRELDPSVEMLRESVRALDGRKAEDAYAEQRLADLLGLLELVSAWCERAQKLSPDALRRLLKLGDKIFKLVE
ncbi:MAG TPA: MarR family transcriptional regulator [Opitutaceae bacterium]|nr:MarR family transcriptional regulator [Opitutaceae bacterium]